jgi:hypothetical protein
MHSLSITHGLEIDLGENIVTHEVVQSKSVAGPVDLRVVCVILAALALFAPFLVTIDLRWGGLELWAMT